MGFGVQFTKDFESLYRSIRPKSASKYYKERLDLRQVDVDAVLHRHCRFNGKHKLAILKAAEKSLPQIATLIGQVFECDPWDLRLARIDFAVDVPGISIRWFRVHMCVPRKQKIKVVGINRETPGDGIETAYFGNGADFIRVYDKENQLNCKSRRPVDTARPALTRIERQVRSGRIPRELTTLRNLMINATNFDPFASVILLPGGKPQPDPKDYLLRRYLEGIGFRQLVSDYGLQEVWSILSARSSGNARRKLRQLDDFIPADPADVQVPNLFSMYQRSLYWQLSGNLMSRKCAQI